MSLAEVTQRVTPELLLELVRPTEVTLSPDGSRLAFAVTPGYRDKSKPFVTRLWVGDVDGAAEELARRSTGGGSGSSTRGAARRATWPPGA